MKNNFFEVVRPGNIIKIKGGGFWGKDIYCLYLINKLILKPSFYSAPRIVPIEPILLREGNLVEIYKVDKFFDVDLVIKNSYYYVNERGFDFILDTYANVGIFLNKDLSKAKELVKVNWFYYR